MKSLNKVFVFLASCMLLVPIFAGAEDLSSIETKQKEAQATSQALNDSLSSELSTVNAKYADIEQLKESIDKNEEQISETKTEIKKTKKNIRARIESVKKQMQEIQLSTSETSIIEVLMTSDSISDFFNKAFVMTTLQKAQSEKIEYLHHEQTRLETLQTTIEKKTKALKENKEDLTKDADILEVKLANLKTKVNENQKVIQQLQTSYESESTHVAEKAAKDKALQQKNTSYDSNKSTSSGSSKKPSKPVTNGNGRVLTVQATGYSWREPGLSYHTATGIDLRVNPNCIAVDPSLIPLGSLVEVPGYGVAIAGDTGGAIQGNIIDLHFSTVQKALNWGRRVVTIKVL